MFLILLLKKELFVSCISKIDGNRSCCDAAFLCAMSKHCTCRLTFVCVCFVSRRKKREREQISFAFLVAHNVWVHSQERTSILLYSFTDDNKTGENERVKEECLFFFSFYSSTCIKVKWFSRKKSTYYETIFSKTRIWISEKYMYCVRI